MSQLKSSEMLTAEEILNFFGEEKKSKISKIFETMGMKEWEHLSVALVFTASIKKGEEMNYDFHMDYFCIKGIHCYREEIDFSLKGTYVYTRGDHMVQGLIGVGERDSLLCMATYHYEAPSEIESTGIHTFTLNSLKLDALFEHKLVQDFSAVQTLKDYFSAVSIGGEWEYTDKFSTNYFEIQLGDVSSLLLKDVSNMGTLVGVEVDKEVLERIIEFFKRNKGVLKRVFVKLFNLIEMNHLKKDDLTLLMSYPLLEVHDAELSVQIKTIQDVLEERLDEDYDKLQGMFEEISKQFPDEIDAVNTFCLSLYDKYLSLKEYYSLGVEFLYGEITKPVKKTFNIGEIYESIEPALSSVTGTLNVNVETLKKFTIHIELQGSITEFDFMFKLYIGISPKSFDDYLHRYEENKARKVKQIEGSASVMTTN
eukprot:TRINITY_DN10830_c0_g1_i1.p1 TRINITY_DN10830_c0_g1~~TRINITY_DN10830_c0_g1_i1.p1  ORF type:complete len:437 (-),score=103.88 TRINITY_DN10830_c0_g1_i1:39-1313(-)